MKIIWICNNCSRKKPASFIWDGEKYILICDECHSEMKAKDD